MDPTVLKSQMGAIVTNLHRTASVVAVTVLLVAAAAHLSRFTVTVTPRSSKLKLSTQERRQVLQAADSPPAGFGLGFL